MGVLMVSVVMPVPVFVHLCRMGVHVCVLLRKEQVTAADHKQKRREEKQIRYLGED